MTINCDESTVDAHDGSDGFGHVTSDDAAVVWGAHFEFPNE